MWEVLQKVGLDCSKYLVHSFRIGAATTATAKGIQDSLIKTMGRCQLCGKLQPAVCLPRDVELFEGNPSTRGHLKSLKNKPQQKQPRKLSVSMLA